MGTGPFRYFCVKDRLHPLSLILVSFGYLSYIHFFDVKKTLKHPSTVNSQLNHIPSRRWKDRIWHIQRYRSGLVPVNEIYRRILLN